MCTAQGVCQLRSAFRRCLKDAKCTRISLRNSGILAAGAGDVFVGAGNSAFCMSSFGLAADVSGRHTASPPVTWAAARADRHGRFHSHHPGFRLRAHCLFCFVEVGPCFDISSPVARFTSFLKVFGLAGLCEYHRHAHQFRIAPAAAGRSVDKIAEAERRSDVCR